MFYRWRDAHNVDEIRDQIVWGGLDHPTKFPSGVKVSYLCFMNRRVDNEAIQSG